jgi:hypothetical protein
VAEPLEVLQESRNSAHRRGNVADEEALEEREFLVCSSLVDCGLYITFLSVFTIETPIGWIDRKAVKMFHRDY